MHCTTFGVLAAVLIALVAAYALAGGGPVEHFGTPYNSEEPTRSYVPFTGRIPYGTWGVTPWALL